MSLQFGLTYAKLLLFGEYSVIQNGAALLLPLKNFSSYFSFMDKATDMELAFTSNCNLKLFGAYLAGMKNVKDNLELDAIIHDIERGLYLWSNIPSGYGVGSSGAVCAAFYRTYGKHHYEDDNAGDLNQLREFFGCMEGFFHGTSSGIDPITCYLSNPLFVKGKKIEILQTVPSMLSDWFLIDSKISRKTEVQVGNFMKKWSDPKFANDFTRNYIPTVDQLIVGSISTSDRENSAQWFTNAIEAISIMQWHYFQEMIPYALKPVWQYGLDTGLYYLKLLGAGGGGYYLCYSRNREKTFSILAANGFNTLTLVV